MFFGNNEYSTALRSVGTREALDQGVLVVHTVRARSRLKMLWLAVRALFRRPEAIEDFEARQVTEATVLCKKRHLAVALDGEVLRMKPPLAYRIRPGALLVRRPAPQAVAAEPAAVPEPAAARPEPAPMTAPIAAPMVAPIVVGGVR